MTRPDRYTTTLKDAGRYVHAKGPHIDDDPDFRPGDLPESRPVRVPPGAHLRDPFYNPPTVRADERGAA